LGGAIREVKSEEMEMREVPFSDGEGAWAPPERVVLVTSVDGDGRPNIIAVGWAMRANVDPPTFAIGLGMRSHSCANITATGEFVFAIPGAGLGRQVIHCGTHSGADGIDKFADTGLTALPASVVGPPLIGECLANLECRVVATQDIRDHRIFFGEVAACWAADSSEPPMLIVGEGSGYELSWEESGFRLGAVKA
jgi:flavin reductase (DIM6/NTAB) family NADH-FMN oxidoreductase RutF